MVTLPWPSTRVTGSMVIFLPMVHSSIEFELVIREVERPALDEGGDGLPDVVGRGRASRQEMVDLDDLVAGIDLVQDDRQVLVVRDDVLARVDRRHVQVGLLEALLEGNAVAQRRQAAHDGALADRDEDLAVPAEVAKDGDVLAVAAAALDQADVAGLGEALDVVDRRLVELDDLDELQDALVDVEDGHVAAEAAGERGGGDDGFAHGLPPGPGADVAADRRGVELALADGHGEAGLLLQNGPDGAEGHGPAGLLFADLRPELGVDLDRHLRAAPDRGEDLAAVLGLDAADAAEALDAAVALHHEQGRPGQERPARPEIGEARHGHLVAVAQGLELAVA